MKIATWNVNSIRIRLEQVVNWLQTNPVEILCLQETKVIDSDFPRSPFLDLGYTAHVCGQKSYNGVAILTRLPVEAVHVGFASLLGPERVGDFDEQKRTIAVVADGICAISVYVPNGSEVDSDKYRYKLAWLKLLQSYLQAALDKYPNLCISGDFNIAPDDRDIHNPKACAGAVGVSALEREALQEILKLGLGDAFRKFISEGGHYTWWDYRAAAFQRNRGWRIDHHYLSPPLYAAAKTCAIDKEPRQWTQPSDHVPVVVEI